MEEVNYLITMAHSPQASWNLRIDNVNTALLSLHQPIRKPCRNAPPPKKKLAFKNVLQFWLGEFRIFTEYKPPVSFHGPAINLSLTLNSDVSLHLSSPCIRHTNLCNSSNFLLYIYDPQINFF